MKLLKHFLFALVSVSMVLLTVSCANDSSSSDESSENNNIEYTKENIDKIVSNIEYSETAQNIIDTLTEDIKCFTSSYYFNGEEYEDSISIIVKTIFGKDNTLKTVAYKHSESDDKCHRTTLSGSGYYYLNADGSSIYLICENQILEAPVELNSNNYVQIGSPSLHVNNSVTEFFAKKLIFTNNTVINETMEPISEYTYALDESLDSDEDTSSGTTTGSLEVASKIEGTWYIKGTSNSTSDGGTAVFSNGTVTYTPDVKTNPKTEGTYSVDSDGVLTIKYSKLSDEKFTVSFDESNNTFTITSKSNSYQMLAGLFQRSTLPTSLTFYSSK